MVFFKKSVISADISNYSIVSEIYIDVLRNFGNLYAKFSAIFKNYK